MLPPSAVRRYAQTGPNNWPAQLQICGDPPGSSNCAKAQYNARCDRTLRLHFSSLLLLMLMRSEQRSRLLAWCSLPRTGPPGTLPCLLAMLSQRTFPGAHLCDLRWRGIHGWVHAPGVGRPGHAVVHLVGCPNTYRLSTQRHSCACIVIGCVCGPLTPMPLESCLHPTYHSVVSFTLAHESCLPGTHPKLQPHTTFLSTTRGSRRRTSPTDVRGLSEWNGA